MTPTETRPTVSVVLPCFNAHAYLTQAVDSVRKQTFRDLEIIIVNDGSTDPQTLSLLDSFPDGIRVIHQENRGLSGARNRGFEEARGRYVLPLDCDDWLDPTYVEKCLAAVADKGEHVFAFAHLYLEGDESGPLAKNFNGFEQLFLNQLPYCLFMPKSLWAEAGGYDETMRQGFEDWEFNIRLCLGNVTGIAIEEPLFHYRVSSTGMLKSISMGKFAELWGHIQSKHRGGYTWSSLLRRRREWRGTSSTYPSWLLLGFLAMYRVLPNPVFNAVFRSAMRFSHTRRTAAKRNQHVSPAS